LGFQWKALLRTIAPEGLPVSFLPLSLNCTLLMVKYHNNTSRKNRQKTMFKPWAAIIKLNLQNKVDETMVYQNLAEAQFSW